MDGWIDETFILVVCRASMHHDAYCRFMMCCWSCAASATECLLAQNLHPMQRITSSFQIISRCARKSPQPDSSPGHMTRKLTTMALHCRSSGRVGKPHSRFLLGIWSSAFIMEWWSTWQQQQQRGWLATAARVSATHHSALCGHVYKCTKQAGKLYSAYIVMSLVFLLFQFKHMFIHSRILHNP